MPCGPVDIGGFQRSVPFRDRFPREIPHLEGEGHSPSSTNDSMKTMIQKRPDAVAGMLVMGMTAAGIATAADRRVPGDYPTIQAAVDAAVNDDTIRIAPGIYAEQVEIVSKTLTVVGQPGTVLRATTNMTAFAGAVNTPIMEFRSSEVTVRGLTFEGERLAEHVSGPGYLLGIYIRNSSGVVENCGFYGFRERSPGAESAIAVAAHNIQRNRRHVRVAGCTFADNYYALVGWGLPDQQTLEASFENNAIIGPGPLGGDINLAGIQISEGVTARIAGNTISGYSYIGTTADSPISFGILGVNTAGAAPDFGDLQPLIIEGNTLRDCQEHIALVKANNSEVRNNRFHGAGPGKRPLGLAVSGRDVTIAGNQFEDMSEGIRLLGVDPDYGTVLGAASNAQVASNRFCNVAAPINRQPSATAIVSGTRTNVCSSDALTVAPAVLVSWPGGDIPGTIESAPTAEGPWTVSSATPFQQSGHQNIAVPADRATRFFRMR